MLSETSHFFLLLLMGKQKAQKKRLAPVTQKKERKVNIHCIYSICQVEPIYYAAYFLDKIKWI